MDFDIHKVKTVKEVWCEEDVQKCINSGWVLLNVCEVRNTEFSDRCYVLGSCEPPRPLGNNSKLQELLKKFPDV